MTTAGPNTILYDEECGFCRWSVNKIMAWDRAKRFRALSIQSDAGASLLAGISAEKLLDSWHFVRADGTCFSAGAAAAPLVRLLPYGKPLARLLDTFPGLTEHAYRSVANNRVRWARLLRIDANRTVRRG
jgi:predicted DCC family thiol-disulfide oxidoreductase YuxK